MSTDSRIDLTAFSERIATLRQRVADNVVGQSQPVHLLLTALMADGHVLLEGVPGVAKTLLAKTLSHLLRADFRRIQFTPDLMPTDVLGTSIFKRKRSSCASGRRYVPSCSTGFWVAMTR